MFSPRLTDNAGGLSLGFRRLLFGLTAVAMLGTVSTAVTERVFARSSAYEGGTRPPVKSLFMQTNQQAFAYAAGQTYEAKGPALTQSVGGQDVYNDRHVVDVNGESIAYIEPGSNSPQVATTAEFAGWVGREISGSLPPANASEGQVGNGTDWRPYAGVLASREMPAAPAAPIAQEAPEVADTTTKIAHVEGGEGGPDVAVTQPAQGATTDTLDPAGPVQVESPLQRKPASDNATASGESLRERAKRH